MRQNTTKLGVLALLLLVISICLTTLGVLTFSTAQADSRMAERYGEMSRQQYQREAEGQAFLEQVEQTLAQGGAISQLPDVTQNGDIFEKSITIGNAALRIGLREDGRRSYEVVCWETEPQWAPQEPKNNLWGG